MFINYVIYVYINNIYIYEIVLIFINIFIFYMFLGIKRRLNHDKPTNENLKIKKFDLSGI